MAATIQLQAVGHVRAVEAATLKPGDLTVWNYGAVEVVTSIEPKGAQSIKVGFRSQNGYEGSRVFRLTRLVGVPR